MKIGASKLLLADGALIYVKKIVLEANIAENMIAMSLYSNAYILTTYIAYEVEVFLFWEDLFTRLGVHIRSMSGRKLGVYKNEIDKTNQFKIEI